MNISNKVLFAAAIFIIGLGSNTFANGGNAGTTAADFLFMKPDARVSALGGGNPAMTTNVHSGLWNPASINYEKRKEVSMSNQLLSNSLYFGALQFLHPLKFAPGQIGASMMFLSSGSIDLTQDSPDAIGTTSPFDLAVTLSYAMTLDKHPILKDFSFGANLKVIHQSLYELSNTGLAMDLGSVYKTPVKGLNAGLSILNLGFLSEGDTVPIAFKIGVEYNYFLDKIAYALFKKKPFGSNREDVRLLLDMEQSLGDFFQMNFGMEFTFIKMIDVRMGYAILHDTNWITAGLGVKYDRYSFDYSFNPRGDLGMAHQVSFTYTWGLSRSGRNNLADLRKLDDFSKNENDVDTTTEKIDPNKKKEEDHLRKNTQEKIEKKKVDNNKSSKEKNKKLRDNTTEKKDLGRMDEPDNSDDDDIE